MNNLLKPRNPRSKSHVDAMVAASLKFLTRYPLITEHSVAKAMNWTQSGLQRAYAARGFDVPNRGFRPMSLDDAIIEAAKMRDGHQRLERLLKDIDDIVYAAETGKLRV